MAEVTAAVRRATEAMEDAAFRLVGRDLGTLYRDQIAREALDAGLDVEEMAQVIYESDGSIWGPWDDVPASQKAEYTVNAAALRAAILGDDA